MNPNPWLTKIVLLVTALSLSGLPAMAQATTAPLNQQQSQPAQMPGNGQVDPSAGPKTPVPSGELPEAPAPAPSEQAAPAPQAQPPAASNTQQSPDQQKGAQEPLGTATAERGTTAGGPASKPAGMAIAPAKQKQTRSLLIKIGAVAAAGAAFGIVYGLTRSTPSLPPGAAAASR
jgi:cobalamin biosynthesis Mg chelatase CobN